MISDRPVLEPEDTPYATTQVGFRTVRRALLAHGSDRIAALHIDFNERNLRISSTGTNNDIPCLMVFAVDKDGNDVEDDPGTEIEFSAFEGWSIWAASGHSDYISVCMLLK